MTVRGAGQGLVREVEHQKKEMKGRGGDTGRGQETASVALGPVNASIAETGKTDEMMNMGQFCTLVSAL